MFALAYGYMNYKFLQDIYNGMFVCDLEVLDPASFKKYYFDKLEESRTSTIVSTLSEYFKENKLQIKEFLKKCEIENEEVYHLIKYHHERPESSQGPFGISENESHDLIQATTLAYRLTSLERVLNLENDAKGFLASRFKKLDRYIRLKQLFEIEFKGQE